MFYIWFHFNCSFGASLSMLISPCNRVREVQTPGLERCQGPSGISPVGPEIDRVPATFLKLTFVAEKPLTAHFFEQAPLIVVGEAESTTSW
jgi:hypothetical protein